MLLAAVPVAIVVVWRFPTRWLYPALLIGVLASLWVLLGQLRGAWIIHEMGLPHQMAHYVSGAIDVLKTGLIFLAVTALVRRAMPSNNALH